MSNRYGLACHQSTPTNALPLTQTSTESCHFRCEPTPAPSHIDLGRLRLPQNFADQLGVTQQPVTVQVRKPHRHWWVSVHPEQDWALTASVIDVEEGGPPSYLVSPDLVDAVGAEATVKAIFAAITGKAPCSSAVRLPSPDGRLDPSNRSALEAVRLAQQRWYAGIIKSPTRAAHEILTAKSVLEDPRWPAMAFDTVVNLAFRDRYIDTVDHRYSDG